MTKRITIKNLKQIDHLVFDLPSTGVHILSGTNGAGKSCLLACLLRIGWPNAFQLSFKTSKISNSLDTFTGAEVIYEIGSDSVTYAYSGERWSPSPKKQSKLLARFGYGSVIYAAANSERIEPRAEDFKPHRVKDAPEDLRKAAQLILGDDKFEHLKVINVRRGVGSEAYLIPTKPSQPHAKRNYYSEKNFSLGEICVLKLLRQLETCANDSLVLIDELELALHPRAQIGLFDYLQQISKTKQLTTIFSTHSSNLIKSINRDKLFFIDRTDGKTSVLPGCYPTYALGQLASKEERAPDIAIYVEDEQAQFIVDAIIKSLLNSEFKGKSKPTIVVTPIGTFQAVIAFLTRSKALIPSSVKQFALLDKDVEDEYLVPLKNSNNYIELAKFQRVTSQIHYLPWTPEVGMCELFAANTKTHEKRLQEFFGDNRVCISAVTFSPIASHAGGTKRKAAKEIIRKLASDIAGMTSRSEERVKQELAEYFAETCLSDPTGSILKTLMLPLIKA